MSSELVWSQSVLLFKYWYQYSYSYTYRGRQRASFVNEQFTWYYVLVFRRFVPMR